MASKIQIRRDTAANWTATNPTLAQGEPGLETDTNRVKYGDGTLPWTSLDYASGGGLNLADSTNKPLWIAVNVDGATSYSRDAETWTPTYYPGIANGYGNAYNLAIGPDAVVYAGASYGSPHLFYAPNAWSNPIRLPETSSVTVVSTSWNVTWLDVIYGGGYYVACGYLNGEGPAGPAWAYSTDGWNWTIRGQEYGGIQFSRVAYNGTGWLFGAFDYGSSSADGYFVSDITTQFIFDEPTWTDELDLDLDSVGWSGNSWAVFDSSAAGGYGVARFSSNANVALNATTPAVWSANSNVASIVFDTLRYVPDNEGPSFVAQASGPITFEGNTKNWHMFGAYTGAVAATFDNGADYVISVPGAYTAPIVYIDAATATIEIPSYNTQQIWDAGEAERITISNASVSGYNGTYYAQYLGADSPIEQYRIYTDATLTIRANTSAWANLGAISGNATLTWSHGYPITGMAIAGNVAFVGDQDDDLYTSTDLQTWTRVVNNDDTTYTGFVDVAYIGTTVTGGMPTVGNIQLTDPADWYISDPVTFTIVNSGDEEYDVITANVTLTRGSGTAVYNSEQESPADDAYSDNDVAPRGTLWNADGWHDFSNVKNRGYTNLYRTLLTDESGTNFGQNIIGAPLVMKDLATGRYFAIKFTGFGNDDEPWVQYTRREINPDYQPGIRFADGTTQTTAYTPILARHTSPGRNEIPAHEWRCEQASGMKVIEWDRGYEANGVPLVANIAGGSAVTFSSTSYSELHTRLLEWNDSGDLRQPASVKFTSLETVFEITSYSELSPGVGQINFTSSNTPFRPTFNVGQTDMTIQVPGLPIEWWSALDLPNGAYNFRGAIIDYHAYAHSNAGNFIGQIMIAKDDEDSRVTHTETTSGYGEEEESFWIRSYVGVHGERRLYYRGRPFNNERVVIQWTAKVFYGAETQNWYD